MYVLYLYSRNLAFTISVKVCMCDAFVFTLIASTAKSRICTVAPAAYQKGPDTPTRHAMFDDINNVAAHVHCDTMTAAVKPAPMLRPAVLNCSDDILVPNAFSSIRVIFIEKAVKKKSKANNHKPSPSLTQHCVHDRLFTILVHDTTTQCINHVVKTHKTQNQK